MKTLPLLIAVVFAAISSPCQVVTNWIPAAPNFREVDGKLYNVEKSALFHQFHGKCEGVSTNNSIAVIPRQNELEDILWQGRGTGFYWQGQTIVVQNYPTNSQPAKGVEVNGYAMKVGTVNLKSGVYELWDYGTPHFVAKVTGVATNSVK